MQCQVRSICRHLGLVRIQVCKAGASESHKGPQELQLEQLTYARPDEGGWSQESAAAHPALTKSSFRHIPLSAGGYSESQQSHRGGYAGPYYKTGCMLD